MKSEIEFVKTARLVILAIVLIMFQNDIRAEDESLPIFPVTSVIQKHGALYSVGLVRERGWSSKLYRTLLENESIVEAYILPRAMPVVSTRGAEKADGPHSWTILENGKFEFLSCVLQMSPNGLSLGLAGILQISMDDLDKPNQGFKAESRKIFPLVHYCTVADVFPLSRLIRLYIYRIRGDKWKEHFSANLEPDREHIELYLLVDGKLEVYRFPTNHFKPVSMDMGEYFENKKAKVKRRQDEGRKLRDREGDGWELIGTLPYLDDEPFLVFDLSSHTYLLNAVGHLYQINKDQLPLTGTYPNWDRKTKPGTRGSIILFKNKDQDTVSLLEVTDDAITPLVFLPDKPEYADPFDPPALTEPQEKALRALLHTMKTTREEPPVPSQSPAPSP